MKLLMLIIKEYGDIVEFKAARTIMGKPVYFSYFYYIDGILIDTGPSHVAREVLKALKNLKLNKVIITHQHEDHTGNCALLHQELGVPIYAHPETIKVLNDPPPIQIYRKVMWGNLPRATARPLEKEFRTDKYLLNTVNTPGHSLDHTCFFEPDNRWLFCGDLYLGENLTGFMEGEDIVDHLKSLLKTINLKPDILFCGLKGYLENATERLIRKYHSWLEICYRVIGLYEQGKTRRYILNEVFGREILFYYFSQSNWGRRYMVDSIINNRDYFKSQKKESLSRL
ncbi:MAG: MBL fold metallo-hydrolase [Bacillota bacterium]|nr:MBL fold metallo-hydrolase [Bacillota bacterium]